MLRLWPHSRSTMPKEATQSVSDQEASVIGCLTDISINFFSQEHEPPSYERFQGDFFNFYIKIVGWGPDFQFWSPFHWLKVLLAEYVNTPSSGHFIHMRKSMGAWYTLCTLCTLCLGNNSHQCSFYSQNKQTQKIFQQCWLWLRKVLFKILLFDHIQILHDIIFVIFI